ncbi:MAG TPA: sialidase family protein, partial [Candidatus Dormibacteraeota bacterium]|nr:sialidase family protein [Candidatus Dormibacteraeota bacterium]
MRLLKSSWQAFLLLSLLLLMLGANAIAQEKANPSERSTTSTVKALPAKSRPPVAQNADAEHQSVSGSPGEREDDADQILRRAEWFYRQRSSANGHIPAGARLKAFQHMQRMRVAEGKLALRPDGTYAAVTPQVGPPVGGAWSSLGPTPTSGGFFSPVSGRVEAIAVDPSDPTGNTVLVGGAQGGIWRSTDGGSTWTPTGDSNPSLAMGSIAFAPSTCNPSPGTCPVYAGTGEQASVGFDVYYGAGVLVSTDHGQTWKQTCTVASTTCPFIGPFNNTVNFGFFNDGGARISYIAVNPSNPNLVLVGAQIASGGGLAGETLGGIYCSSDGGATWTPLLSGEAGSFVGFASSTVAYAALGRPDGSAAGAANPNGIYKSTNADAASCSGITFAPVAQQPTLQTMGRIDLAIAPSDTSGNTVYASIANGSDGSRINLGVFVTTNGGTSWTQTTAPDICRFQCWY